jgi:hypothetical protein
MHRLRTDWIRAPYRWLGGGGLLVVTLVAISLVGLPGLLVGGLLAVSWTRLPPEYTFALGQFALVLGMPTAAGLSGGFDGSPTLLAIGELGLVALLVAPPVHRILDRERKQARARTDSAMAVPVVAIGLSSLAAWVSVAWLESIWVAVVGGAALAISIAIGLYEYEYWVLDTAQERSTDHE